MKRSRKVVALGLCLPLLLGLIACHQNNTRTEAANQTQTSSDKVPWTASYTNLNSQVSSEEVKSLLSAHLDPNSVEAFFNLVTDYNATVGSTGLSGDFTSFTKTEYDVEKISNLWNQKKGDFVGTNCRINSYALLKNSVTIPKLEKNWDEHDKEKAQLNAKAMDVLCYALDANEFNRISTCSSTKKIWNRLEVTHEDTNQAKKIKDKYVSI